LISLILAAGLGLDYALFFEHAADDAAEQARTLHAVLTCAASTLLVFVLLATADLPVLRAIGAPVALGVVANFVLALLLTRGSPTGLEPRAGKLNVVKVTSSIRHVADFAAALILARYSSRNT
jgi:predicted exporter